VLRNRLGLHARPAAQLVRTVSAFDALVTVNGVDARSVLALVGLGTTGGQQVVVAATGPQARNAVNAVVDELENGFGEA
jgi:PTS hybrid protein